jgi:hypothetical protein
MKSNPIPKWPRKTWARDDKMSSAKQKAVVAPPAILSYPLAGDNCRDSLPAPSSPMTPPRFVSTLPSAGDKEDEERLDLTYSSNCNLIMDRNTPQVTRSQKRNLFLE